MTCYEGCPHKAVDLCEFPVATGTVIGTGHEFGLCAIVHQALDKCMNARGKVFVVFIWVVHVRGLLGRASV